MEEKYSLWIAQQGYDEQEKSYGNCALATLSMTKAFPELKRVAGFYHCPIWGAREHWWCVDAENNIVDPTASQFPSKGNFDYEELPENFNSPIGKCMNCGEYCLENESPSQYACSERCQALLSSYYNLKF